MTVPGCGSKEIGLSHLAFSKSGAHLRNTPAEILTSLDRAASDVKNGDASGCFVTEVNVSEDLDYDGGSDEWEEGEVQEDGEVSLPMVQGTSTGGATDPSVGVLQQSSADDGGTTVQWKEAHRGSRKVRQKAGGLLPSGKKDWWWDTQNDRTGVGDGVTEGAGKQTKEMRGGKEQTQEPNNSNVA
ncbi:hypothetical protein NDU88_000315 [Pleurodeles waltl]|uniref:Uncharacterized protein n=1 Tax=Pleurodeles waltl TaxID=8319 RepID=A0AAV7VTS2_PLEWA|nr:hypothetical protein NDU88_000315 [Pleurodeles waltl]